MVEFCSCFRIVSQTGLAQTVDREVLGCASFTLCSLAYSLGDCINIHNIHSGLFSFSERDSQTYRRYITIIRFKNLKYGFLTLEVLIYKGL